MTPPHRLEEQAARAAKLYSSEAEQRLLGSLLCDNRNVALVADRLEPDDFGNALHGRIWTSITMQVGQGALANPVLLGAAFDRDPMLSEIGGQKYLTQLAVAGAKVNPNDYAHHIRELAQRRDIRAAAQDLMDAAEGDLVNVRPADIVARFRDQLDQIKPNSLTVTTPIIKMDPDYALSSAINRVVQRRNIRLFLRV